MLLKEGSHATKMMYAIRTEHLEHDWTTIDRMLGGGAKDNNTTFTFVHKNKWSEVGTRIPDKTLSNAARSNICRALCEEIQIYKQMLRLAVNINADEEQISLNELLGSCPRESREIRDCTRRIR